METEEIQPSKPYSEAVDHEEFKQLRAEVEEKKAKTAAEPAAEKPPQSEEDKPVIASEKGAEKPIQEPPAEKPVDDQIKELRAKGKHAQANKLMVEAATKTANERAEKAERDLETLRSRPSQTPASETKPATPQATQVTADPTDPRPKPADAKYAGADGYDAYVEDIGRWGARQEFRAQHERASVETSQRETARAIMGRIQAFKALKPEHADFDTVTAGSFDAATNTGTGLWLTPAMMQFTRESDAAPAVLYHLGKNLAEHARIVALSPAMQLANLGQIAHLITTPAANAATPEKRKPAVTRAAAPPTVLTGSDEPEPGSLSEATSYEDFKARRKARQNTRSAR